jgi:hypothetical protein
MRKVNDPGVRDVMLDDATRKIDPADGAIEDGAIGGGDQLVGFGEQLVGAEDEIHLPVPVVL